MNSQSNDSQFIVLVHFFVARRGLKVGSSRGMANDAVLSDEDGALYSLPVGVNTIYHSSFDPTRKRYLLQGEKGKYYRKLCRINKLLLASPSRSLMGLLTPEDDGAFLRVSRQAEAVGSVRALPVCGLLRRSHLIM